MQREPPLVAVLRKQQATKESRYARLLSNLVEAGDLALPRTVSSSNSCTDQERVSRLEEAVAPLQNEGIRQQRAEFRKQFE